jgi:hypothetical protein
MAEWSVAKIMKQGSNYGDLLTFFIRLVACCYKLALNHLNQPARGMKDTNAMCKPSMGGAWEYEIRHAKLLDPAKALKFWCIQQPPGELI